MWTKPELTFTNSSMQTRSCLSELARMTIMTPTYKSASQATNNVKSTWKAMKWVAQLFHYLLSASSNVITAVSPFCASFTDDTSPPPCLRCWKWITMASSLVPGEIFDTRMLLEMSSEFIFLIIEECEAILLACPWKRCCYLFERSGRNRVNKKESSCTWLHKL